MAEISRSQVVSENENNVGSASVDTARKTNERDEKGESESFQHVGIRGCELLSWFLAADMATQKRVRQSDEADHKENQRFEKQNTGE